MFQFLKMKLIKVFMLVLMLSYQLILPDMALGGRRWWCRHHRCYHNYGYHCSYYPNYGCSSHYHFEDDYFVRVHKELRDDATLSLIIQNASNQLASLAVLQGRAPQLPPVVQAPTYQAAPAPVALPQYQQYQQPVQQVPQYYQPQQSVQQQIPMPVPQQYQYLQQPQSMNNVPPASQQQMPYQAQQPQYYQPQQQVQTSQQPASPAFQPPYNMGDPYPQQPPQLSDNGTANPQTNPIPSTTVDVATYLSGLKAAYVSILATDCARCHGSDKYAQHGGNIDLSDVNKIDFGLAEKIFFEAYTGNMPKDAPPLPKVKIDILSDYAFLLKNQAQATAMPVPQSAVNPSPVPVSQ